MVGCPQLNDDRKAINIAEGFSFYSVKPISQEIDLGIALVGGLSKYRETNSQIAADINNDGVSDYFTQCSSSEGIHFNVWSEKPWIGKLLWSSYYYLGYDIEPNCPK